ncbi:MBL fold metallo-hydrolase [Flavobacteriaceae bacterium 14752]|uniref:MBL fold metallo-hydrolase n=1 Tax=Mesohalobacter salilacus TaxID=2491711 RepID=UPI000F63C7A9|nr:MBL fold metallo-hydrolase [Flavobacteriaceae bacterium 14752]
MKSILNFFILLLIISCKSEPKDESKTSKTEQKTETQKEIPVEITPIEHATFVMEWADEVVYVDPNGGVDAFKDLPKPSLVLITDIHGDHFNLETLKGLSQSFDMVAPQAVYDKMPKELQNKTKILANGKSFDFHGFNLKGVPMYNITEARLKYHEKGRGNGYVVSKDNYKVYISGDTEAIPEMKSLTDIDLAFMCMNLPYTMPPEMAAEAVLSFKPKKVLPYHYRGMKDGKPHFFSVEKFKEMVQSQNDEIEVSLLDWYPKKSS